jgi:hypothetical protein
MKERVMRHMTSVTAIGLLLALTACGGQAANNSVEAANEATTGGNAAAASDKPAEPAANASVAAAPTATGGATLTRDYVVGRWTNTGDCADAIEFRADGGMAGPFGEDARWELRGDQLFMVGNPDPLRIVVVDERTMTTTGPSGNARRATRC